MAPRFLFTVVSAVFLATLGSALQFGATARAAQRVGELKLPPITHLCPMNGVSMPDGTIHADVYQDKAGTCAICKMALVAARLESIWTCPVHSVIHERQAGLCPIDRRELVPVTVALSWTCKANPEIDQITPAQCPDGSAMIAKYTPRPHGNHNPQHGGQFFMAPDNWTHLEGTLPQDRLVRIYFYDDYTKPLPREKFAPIRGHIITKVATGGTTKQQSFPLVAARDGRYLEVKVDTAFPGPVVAKITLKPGGPEHHFDFTFKELTKELPAIAATSSSAKPSVAPARTAPARMAAAPPAPTASAASATAAPQAPAPAVPAAAATTAQDPPMMVNAALLNVAIPGTLGEILTEIGVRDRQLRGLVDAGRFADIWLPAFEAKDLALALSSYGPGMPTYKRRGLDPAIRQLLHAAWMLDSFGDLGNRDQVTAAYAQFSSAVAALDTLLQDRNP